MFLLGSLLGGPFGEEPGWRGYALPKLQEKYRILGASLILGVLWTMWHLPFFFIQGTFNLPPLSLFYARNDCELHFD
ncbi:CPBP family intramembrane glutamic endopeptidase [Paenibacillus sp. UNC496MF]|uniref:CPBP family intramembrane glutamic endopeptidase n=1 Tax=Paenibacillus sp. UNC496MF TaxID=1502753 RepID=UPI00210BF244|nr:CPBP family intramembrane glutamic endopeptidase [Paenibacillus sp. UNC496MF]